MSTISHKKTSTSVVTTSVYCVYGFRWLISLKQIKYDVFFFDLLKRASNILHRSYYPFPLISNCCQVIIETGIYTCQMPFHRINLSLSRSPRGFFPLGFSIITFFMRYPFLPTTRGPPILIVYFSCTGKYLGVNWVFVLHRSFFFRKFLKPHCTLVQRFFSIFSFRSLLLFLRFLLN